LTAQLDDRQPASALALAQRLSGGLRISPVVLILIVILLVLVAPPVIFLLQASVHETLPDGSAGAFTLRFYQQLFSGRQFLPSLLNTVIYACGSAVVAIFVGTLQALIVERTNAPGRKLAFLAAIISLGVPHVLYVVSWLLLLGRAGPVNHLLMQLLQSEQPVLNVYSLWGMMLIEGVGFVPLTFLLMSAVLRSTDASFEEAALMSGANPQRTFAGITLRMALPALSGLTLLIFIRAFESFEVPALVGMAGHINVITTMIFQSSRRAGSPDYGEAGAYSVCLVAILMLLIFWQNRLSSNAQRYQTVTGKGFRPRVLDLGPWRFAASGILLALFLFVTVIPVIILIFTSFQPYYEGVSFDSFRRLSLENYRLLWGPGSFRDSILNTFILGAATATLVVPFTALCAWLVVRRAPGAAWIDQIASVPLVFPAIILSVAFLDLFVNMSIPLYGTLISVVIASSVRYLPYGMRYAFAGTIQIHSDLEEAATTSGATQTKVFLRVLVPLLAGTLISSWLLIFLVSVQAVSLPLLLVGPGSQVMAVTLFELWQNGQVTELAAMGVLWIVLMTTVSVIFHLVTRRHDVAVG
jgi:iron(III) transport system permease protein